VGPSAMHSVVRSHNVLVRSGSLCASAYAPNLTQQCLVKSILCLVAMSLGLRSMDTLLPEGKALIHIVTNFNKCIIIWFGMHFLHGSSLDTLLARSLIVRMHRSTSPTCSHVAVVLITTSSMSLIILSNSMSIRHACTVNPPL